MEIPCVGAQTDDSSSEEEDEETLLRLREAVDSKFILPDISGVTTTPNQESSSHKISPAIGEVSEETSPDAGEDCKSLSDKIKSQLKKFKKKTTEPQPCKNPKSLRRDKQDQVQLEVMSELNVTPQFQKFVGSKLDQLLSEQIEDISHNMNILPTEGEGERSVKLLKRSRRTIQEKYSDKEIKRKRPDLLAHKRIQPEDSDYSELAVSGEFVRSQADTRAWVNRYPDRTEPGIQRIKRKKNKNKNKKKKKKKSASDLSEAGCDNPIPDVEDKSLD